MMCINTNSPIERVCFECPSYILSAWHTRYLFVTVHRQPKSAKVSLSLMCFYYLTKKSKLRREYRSPNHLTNEFPVRNSCEKVSSLFLSLSLSLSLRQGFEDLQQKLVSLHFFHLISWLRFSVSWSKRWSVSVYYTVGDVSHLNPETLYECLLWIDKARAKDKRYK